MAGEQLAQRAVLDVGESVVRHEPPGHDPPLGKGGERPFDEARDGLRLLVLVQLDVGEP